MRGSSKELPIHIYCTTILVVEYVTLVLSGLDRVRISTEPELRAEADFVFSKKNPLGPFSLVKLKMGKFQIEFWDLISILPF